MSFTSVTFIFYFLPLFLLLSIFVTYTYLRNIVLLLASALFYLWGEVDYGWVLLVSTLANYGIAILIEGRNGRSRSVALWLGIALNIGALAVFKYSVFMNYLFQVADPFLEILRLPAVFLTVHPPIGISFFTFKAISYLVDVHRNDTRAERDPIIFATYLSMFPQILAGPIARFSDCAKDFRDRPIGLSTFRAGAERFILGLAQKLLIANVLAEPANAAFSAKPAELTTALAWVGAACYTLQIYFDFAGYTSMAIGIGQMLGFKFPENFNFPYSAQSITDFWQRWHITLSTWLRDYLWFPLGANRRGRVRTIANLLVVFGLCGLWHGAAFTFVTWGLFHGALLAAERFGWGRVLKRFPPPIRTGYALSMVIVGWVIFRADSVSAACRFLAAMVGITFVDARAAADASTSILRFASATTLLAFLTGAVFSFPWTMGGVCQRLSGWSSDSPLILRITARAVVLGLFLLSLMSIAAGSHNPFLYFRF